MAADPIPAGGISSGGGVALAFGASAPPPPARRGSLADDIDPVTGELLSLLGTQHPVDAAVAFGFTVERGSGVSVGNVGHRYREIRKKGDAAERQLADEAARVLQPFVERQLVAIVTSEADADDGTHGADGAGQLVQYRNRITSRDEEVARP